MRSCRASITVVDSKTNIPPEISMKRPKEPPYEEQVELRPTDVLMQHEEEVGFN
jgi:hypothetical protein